jgi:ketosteroid isomerase-like protein
MRETGSGEGDASVTALREALAERATSYLAALDRLELDSVVSFFAEDAVLDVRTGELTVHGSDEIRELWQSFFRSHSRMEHRVTRIIVDEVQRIVVTEQEFTGTLVGGATEERTSVYLFQFGADTRFADVSVWIDRETPARASGDA